jgi:hypothetical protein
VSDGPCGSGDPCGSGEANETSWTGSAGVAADEVTTAGRSSGVVSSVGVGVGEVAVSVVLTGCPA